VFVLKQFHLIRKGGLMLTRRLGFGLATTALVLLATPADLLASPLIFILNDPANGVSGTATFNTAPGGFYIEITNTESNTADAGHAISQFLFTVGDGFALPSALTQIKGTTATFTGPTTSVDDHTSTNSVDHWLYSTASPNGDLFDVNGTRHQPNHLIVAAGSSPNASLRNTHLPSFVGPVDFYFTDAAGVPTSTLQITDFKFAFGTGPEVPLESGVGQDLGGATPGISTPEPSSVSLLCAGVFSLFVYRWRRRNKES
jgi:hypothetical protein